MENILHESNEIVISLVTEYLKNLETDRGIAEFTEDLNAQLMKLGNQVTKFILDYAEETIFKLKERKEKFSSIDIDERKIISIFGEIDFCRRYYLDKETRERIYLLDEFFKLKPRERLLSNVEERLIEEAIVTTYEHAGKKAAYGTTITRQTTKNKIASLKVLEENKSLEKKKQVKTLYIIADEDHVALQKGGIEEPRFVMVYENFVSKGKRIQLIEKQHFGGLYKGKIDDLWEEVLTYIDSNYDLEYIEKIYISGDGASWIKTGLEWIPKSIFVLDRFHLKKAINAIVGRETKEAEDIAMKQEYKIRIYKSLHKGDFEETREIVYEILAEEMDKNKRERKLKLLKYILNNKEGIINFYNNRKELHGCSAEGHISHIYSDRLSSRPKGWCITNLDNMSRLRILKENNGNVKTLIENKNKIIEFKEIEKIRNQSNARIKETINIKTATIPAIQFGTTGTRKLFKDILEYESVC